MMKFCPEDIVEALRIISATCDNCATCSECPFSAHIKNDTECLIKRDEPANWLINEPPEVWKALE